MQKIIILFFIVLFSCSNLPQVHGKENEITILISPEDKDYALPILESFFSEVINTPQAEKKFPINYVNPWEIETVQYRPNLLIISLTNPIDSTGDYLYRRFNKSIQTENPIWLLENVYAEEQNIILLKSIDTIHLENILNENHDWIFSNIINKIDLNILRYIKTKGENTELISKIKSKFDLDIIVQKDYKLLSESPDSSFLWIGRGYPYRWLTLHIVDRHLFENPGRSFVSIDSLFAHYLPDITVSQHYKSFYVELIKQKVIPILRGLYDHEESQTGGPWVMYVIGTNDPSKVILATGFVNNPGHEKVLQLLQLEVLFRNIIQKES